VFLDYVLSPRESIASAHASKNLLFIALPECIRQHKMSAIVPDNFGVHVLQEPPLDHAHQKLLSRVPLGQTWEQPMTLNYVDFAVFRYKV
jgi:hypothetical protein